MTKPSNECQECERTVVLDKWRKIRAHDEGWYFMRDGRVWCPDHRPPWAPPHDAKK